jgi:hypothetical protein
MTTLDQTVEAIGAVAAQFPRIHAEQDTKA